MVEIRKSEGEVILSRDELRKVESFQAAFAAIWNEMRDSVEEFDNIILRHYFNRENGYLEEQQNNLREIVLLQDRMEELAARLGGSAAELKAFMKSLQQGMHGAAPAAPQSPGPSARPKSNGAGDTAADRTTADKTNGARRSRLLLSDRDKLADSSQRGGEISIKLFFEELGLLHPERHDLLREITRQLHELLYERKLVGYSKTSLVFGRDRSLEEVLVSLEPVFLSERVRELLAAEALAPGGARLVLGCGPGGELVYVSAAE
ncbi:hypothetical protein LLH00_17815 [bacterium]|nr:hypothetical protein [bacterium]